MLCHTAVFTANSRTHFAVIFVTLSPQRALCMKLQVRYFDGTGTLCRHGNVISYFLRHHEHNEKSDGLGQHALELVIASTTSSNMEVGKTIDKGKRSAKGQVLDRSNTPGLQEKPANKHERIRYCKHQGCT